MSGYPRQGNRYATGKSDRRMKQMVWIPKTKIATDGSLGRDSCCQKDNSSPTVECTSSSCPEPDLDTHLQQESLLPTVKDVSSGMEKFKLMPNSCQMADNGSKYLGPVSTSDYSSKDSVTFSSQSGSRCMLPITEKSQKGERSDTAAETQLESDSTTSFKLKDSTLSTPSDPSYMHSYASKGPTGPVACFSLKDGIPEKGKQFGDISQEKADSSRRSEDTDRASSILRFDICPERVSNVIKLNPSLHVTNKEKRNQSKCSEEGKNIIMLRPGMVLMKGYISCNDQISIVKDCREFGISDGGFYQPGYREGAKLHLKMMCLGKNWDPQSREYSDMRLIDNSKPPGIPDKFRDMVKRAMQDSNAHVQKNIAKADAGKIIPSMSPDICIVNFYTKGGKLGLHQDKDESAESLNRGLPVVSFSIGDSAEFLYGDSRDIDKADKVILQSGDVLIFGGKSRHIFHGVASISPDTAPSLLLEATNLCPGRLNLTFRQF